MSAFFAFLHHLAAFALVSALAVELITLRDPLSLTTARRLLFADAVFGISAGVILLVGLGRVFHFEKGSFYYLHNEAFIAKFSIFLLVGLLSIVPTLEFLSWRKTLKQGALPTVTAAKLGRIRSIVHLELMGIVLILLCAALMAKGIGGF